MCVVYGVSKSSRLILFFTVWGTSTLLSVTALLKFHRQPQWRWISFCPHPLHNLLFVEFLTKAILSGMRLYLMVLWISISRTLSDVDSFSWDLFRMVWLKLTCWKGFLKVCPSWPSFSLTCPRILWEGRCFLLAAPQALWIRSAHPHTFARGLWQKTRRRPHVFRPHADFFSLL